MNVMVEKILNAINRLDELLWLLRFKAVQHRDKELLTHIGNLEVRLNEIFLAVAELGKKK